MDALREKSSASKDKKSLLKSLFTESEILKTTEACLSEFMNSPDHVITDKYFEFEDRRTQFSSRKTRFDTLNRRCLDDMCDTVSRASVFAVQRKMSAGPALQSLKKKRLSLDIIDDDLKLLECDYMATLDKHKSKHSAVIAANRQIRSSGRSYMKSMMHFLVLSRISASEMKKIAISTGELAPEEKGDVLHESISGESSQQRIILANLFELIVAANSAADAPSQPKFLGMDSMMIN